MNFPVSLLIFTVFKLHTLVVKKGNVELSLSLMRGRKRVMVGYKRPTHEFEK